MSFKGLLSTHTYHLICELHCCFREWSRLDNMYPYLNSVSLSLSFFSTQHQMKIATPMAHITTQTAIDIPATAPALSPEDVSSLEDSKTENNSFKMSSSSQS